MLVVQDLELDFYINLHGIRDKCTHTKQKYKRIRKWIRQNSSEQKSRASCMHGFQNHRLENA